MSTRRGIGSHKVVATLKRMPAAGKPVLRKVCGITRAEDAANAVRAGANALGLIFYPPSPRAVTVAQAEKIVSDVPAGIRRVGVFVQETPNRIATAIERVPLDVVQLAGGESPDDCHAVRRAAGDRAEIWKAVRVGPRFDDSLLSEFDVDAFLLDTLRDGLHGGTGEVFPWQLALSAKRHGNIIIAGGLDAGNVAEAIRIARPWGVDSSSRLEREPGVKDPERVARFLQAAN